MERQEELIPESETESKTDINIEMNPESKDESETESKTESKTELKHASKKTQEMSTFMSLFKSRLVIVTNSLFDAPPTHALAHAVSEDMVMGKGIAVEFVQRFGKKRELHAQGKVVGQVAYLLDSGNRPIFYMITKKVYYGKPTYTTITAAIQSLCVLCKTLGVTHLDMPKIGCGLDRLDWLKVKIILEREFNKTRVDVTIHDYNHDGI